MRKIHRTAGFAIAVMCMTGALSPVRADEVLYLDRGGDRGFSLPGVTLPQGQDEVRAADGTTCRSAVGGSGAYLDVGAIKDQMGATGRDMSTYARVVVPLGARSSRLDCSKLYKLEIERLEAELRLLKMGVVPGGPAQADTVGADGNAMQEGWSREGMTDPPAPEPAKRTADKKRKGRAETASGG